MKYAAHVIVVGGTTYGFQNVTADQVGVWLTTGYIGMGRMLNDTGDPTPIPQTLIPLSNVTLLDLTPMRSGVVTP